MAYLSLYRKWRPQSFEEVVGQEHVVRTLKNALDSRRVAHAYLFAGPRGTGKTTLARLLAKGLNCEKGPTGSPCNTCANCTRIARGICVDVIEIDGASNRGIDEIRDVREMVKFAPAEGEYKVYIIDEVHMLTTEAFNALLKVLEEPPQHVVFVFATTEPHKIPATIVSRCQKFDFRTLGADEIVSQLRAVAGREGIDIEPRALDLIARHSDGGMRDALSFLDQCIAFGLGAVSESVVAQVLGVVEAERLDELAESLATRDLGRCLMLVKSVADAGRDLKQFAADAVRYFRDLLVLAAAPESEQLVSMPTEAKQRARAMAGRFTLAKLIEIVETLGRAENDMRWASAPQLPLELALIELVKGSERAGWEDLVQRVDALERRLAQLASAGVPLPQDAPAERRPVAPAAPPEASAVRIEPERPPFDPTIRPTAKEVVQTPKETAGLAQPGGYQPVPGAGNDAATADLEASEFELLEIVRKAWPRVLEQLRAARYVQQEAFLREGSPIAVDGDTVIVGFSPNHRFHQANMEKDKNRAIVEKVLSKVLGRSLRMRSVLGTEWHRPPAQGDGDASSRPGQFPAPSGGGGPTGEAGCHSGAAGQGAVPAANVRPDLGEAIDPTEIDEPIVHAALKLFGGTITRIERTEAEET